MVMEDFWSALWSFTEKGFHGWYKEKLNKTESKSVSVTQVKFTDVAAQMDRFI